MLVGLKVRLSSLASQIVDVPTGVAAIFVCISDFTDWQTPCRKPQLLAFTHTNRLFNVDHVSERSGAGYAIVSDGEMRNISMRLLASIQQCVPGALKMYAYQSMSIEEIYGEVSERICGVRIDDAPHTMGVETLNRYVKNKFSDDQVKLLLDAAKQNQVVEVVGVYDQHATQYSKQRGLQLGQCVPGKNKADNFGRIRPVNSKRPVLYSTSTGGLILFVFPSREYVEQYAELVLALWRDVAPEAAHGEHSITIRHFDRAYERLADWTGLAECLRDYVRAGDLAVMGNVDIISENLEQRHAWTKTTEMSFGLNNIFRAYVHENDRFGRVVLLAMQYSFWGSTSGIIADALVNAGATDVIYAGKMGSLTHPSEIHSVVVPRNGYFIWSPSDITKKEGNIRKVQDAPPVGIDIPLLNLEQSGLHLSVPTVTGETLRQQESYRRLGIATIDNEISYIAKRLAGRRREICFTAIHFVTDFVGNDLTKDAERKSDLSVSESKEVKKARIDAFEKIASTIATHALMRYGRLRHEPECCFEHHDSIQGRFYDRIAKIIDEIQTPSGMELFAFSHHRPQRIAQRSEYIDRQHKYFEKLLTLVEREKLKYTRILSFHQVADEESSDSNRKTDRIRAYYESCLNDAQCAHLAKFLRLMKDDGNRYFLGIATSATFPLDVLVLRGCCAAVSLDFIRNSSDGTFVNTQGVVIFPSPVFETTISNLHSIVSRLPFDRQIPSELRDAVRQRTTQ